MGFYSSTNAAPPNASVVNAGKSRIYGVEVEATISPFRGLLIDAAYTYLNSKVESLKPVVFPPGSIYDIFAPSTAVGLPLPLTPENKANVSVTYTLPLDESIGKIAIGADYSYTDPELIVVSTTPYGYAPAYGLLNFHVNWNSVLGKPVDASFFMTNATDKFYWTNITDLFNNVGFEPRTVGEPRMFGFRLRARFGS